MYSTLESKSQIDAFITIEKQFQNNVISYNFHNSGCSCCLSEAIYILCKINNIYKLYCYNAYLKHEKKNVQLLDVHVMIHLCGKMFYQ